MPNKEQFKGKFNEAAGSIKKGAGSLVGDREMEAEGEAQKFKGKGQGFVGGAKEKAHDFGHKAKHTFEGAKEAAKDSTKR